MTGTKNTALRNLLADALGNNFNNGTLNIYTSNATLLADFTFAADAYGAAAAGVITGSFVSTTISGRAAGDADNATLISAQSTYQITGLTVGTGTQDVVIDNVSPGQDITVNSHTWTESASTA